MNTLNVTDALARLDRLGGRALVEEVLAAFRRQGPARAKDVRDACSRNDAVALARGAHALKSSCGQLGAAGLSDLCARLEAFGESGAVREAQPLADRLEADVESLIGDLESWLARNVGLETRRRRIGLVEDSDDTRLILRKILEPYYEVDECADGPAALARFSARPPDAILLDISLPGMDGPEVLCALRAEPACAGIPVIALTAHAMVGDREAFLARGFDEYVSKPILDELELLRVIAAAMDGPHDA